jgi:hypothetical protein
MSGGQNRNDEANGPSRSGEVKRKEAEIAINQALLRRHTGALRESKN